MAIEQRRSFVLQSSDSMPSYDPIMANGILQERSANAGQQNDGYERSNMLSMRLNPPMYGGAPIHHQHQHDGYSLGGLLASQGKVRSQQTPLRPRLVAAYDEKKFDILWQRLWDCDGFRKYRDGQEKGQRGSGGAQVWPVLREEAFFRGCVAHPPMGRTKKQYYSAKSLGRNELIAAFINNWLDLKGDEQLRRKQVSSHIQVLKGYFKTNKYVLSFLQGDEKKESKHSNQKLMHASRRMEHVRSMLSRSSDLTLPPPPNTLPSQRSTRVNNFQITDFNMCLQNEQKDTLHTFTRLQQGCGMPDIHLEERPNWPDLFPELADLHRERSLDCEILFTEATLKLTDVTTECDLAVETCVISHDPPSPGYRLQCDTTIFERGAVKASMSQDVSVESVKDYYRLGIPFASSYWVQKFSKLKNVLRVASRIPQFSSQPSENNTNPTTPNRASINKAHKDVRTDIETTTALQEIFAVPDSYSGADPSEQRRLLVVYWKFRQTSGSGSEEGATQTRYLYPPRSEDEVGTQKYSSESNPHAVVRYGQESNELGNMSSVSLLDPSMYEFDAVTAMASLAEPGSHSREHSNNNDPYVSGQDVASSMSMNFHTDSSFTLPGVVESDNTIVPTYYPVDVVKESSQIEPQYDHSFRFWANEGMNYPQQSSQCEIHSALPGFTHSATYTQQQQQHHRQQQTQQGGQPHRLSQSTTDGYSQSYGSPFSEDFPATQTMHSQYHHQSHGQTSTNDYFGGQQQQQQSQGHFNSFQYQSGSSNGSNSTRFDNSTDCTTPISPVTAEADYYCHTASGASSAAARNPAGHSHQHMHMHGRGQQHMAPQLLPSVIEK